MENMTIYDRMVNLSNYMNGDENATFDLELIGMISEVFNKIEDPLFDKLENIISSDTYSSYTKVIATNALDRLYTDKLSISEYDHWMNF